MIAIPSTALACTLVHAPGAVPESFWNLLHREAGGAHPHEVRILLEGSATPSGVQIYEALSAWIRSVQARHPSTSPGRSVSGAPSWIATLDRVPLQDHGTGSAAIHSGMVVTLHPRAGRRPTGRHGPSRLRLCVGAGPDSGWLVNLPRGVHVLGRGTGQRGAADIRINDPLLERSHARIMVSSSEVTLTRPEAAVKLRMSTDAPVDLGSSRIQLAQEPPSPTPDAVWPLPPMTITEEPPSGRHRRILLMSLAPLVIGIVLVLVTGMWFFLLFSALSAVVAGSTVVDGHRKRRRFRRAVRAAAAQWAHRRKALLPTPGHAVRALRAGSRPRGAFTAAGGVVVTVGEARIEVDLDCKVEPGPDLPEARVATATAMTLLGAECTVLLGPKREQLSVLRWVLAQLTHHLHPGPELLLTAGSGESTDARLTDLVDLAELRDYPRVTMASGDNLQASLQLRESRSAMDPASVLLSLTGLESAQLRAALAAGRHVILLSAPAGTPALRTPGGWPQLPAPMDGGWQVNLTSGEIHRIEAGTARSVGTDLLPDGLSRRTLHEHLRLGLRHSARPTDDVGIPLHYATPLPFPLMTHSAQLSLRTLLGRSASEDEFLDLVADGPHILLAGTTGAGKSELLKSMLLGWVARYGPEELNLLLFDFKGGSTFQPLVGLEHTLGLVTDLTQAQSERALEGVWSELTRREQLFLESGATDYADYRRSHPDAPLARLLVVIDEFRVFTQELPAAMDELMRLATLGRSLGLHLILATQRPQGVVTADIRANIGSIICLRLRSEDEARDLVGTPEPGRIPRQIPGRGVIQRPGEPPVGFQGVQLLDASVKLQARPEKSPASAAPGWRETTPDLVKVLDGHLLEQLRRRPHTPICPGLPETLSAPLPAAEIQFGLIDDPGHQKQHLLRLDLGEGQGTALLGEAESGGTAALQCLVRQLLALTHEVHVYLLDGDHSLEMFRRHPRVGSWVTTDHPQEAQHLVQELHRRVTRRRIALPQGQVPMILVMSGHSRWHGLDHTIGGSGFEQGLGALITEGAGFGFSALISGGRDLALGKLGSRLPRRVYLPYGVPEEIRYLWPKLRATDRLPGRGVLVGPDHPPPGLAIQLVTDILEHRQRRTPPRAAESGRASMLTVHPLPGSVELPAPGPPPGALTLGIRQFTHAHAMLEDRSWQVGLILGAAQTGKTNALRVVAAQRRCWTLDELAEATASEVSHPEIPEILLVDDADRCTPLEHRSIEEWLSSGGKVLATAAPHFNVFSQLPWAYRARGAAANFLLSPMSRTQGDALGASVPVLTRLTPGRAAWIGVEGVQIIQWWKHQDLSGP